jgi:CheY-like chemotaxis protein
MTENIAAKTLLIVDDDPITRAGLAATLEAAGHAVVPVANGAEALDYLHHHAPPDLILLDMLMPVLDGWHLLDQLKRTPSGVAARVVVVTATILTPDWAAQNGCAGFLRKPITTEELLAEVRRCLGSG